jgi:hypothetical protein
MCSMVLDLVRVKVDPVNGRKLDKRGESTMVGSESNCI